MGNLQKYWSQNVGQGFIVLDFFVGCRLCGRKRCVREINVSRAWNPVHEGDKALTRETPVKRGRVNRYACVVFDYKCQNSLSYEKWVKKIKNGGGGGSFLSSGCKWRLGENHIDWVHRDWSQTSVDMMDRYFIRAPDKLRICVFYAMKMSKNACIIRSECTHYACILLCKPTFQIRSVLVQSCT